MLLFMLLFHVLVCAIADGVAVSGHVYLTTQEIQSP